MTMAMPSVTQLASNWWALALRGVLALLVGFLALTRPGITLGAIVFLLGAYMFVDGVFAIMAALRGIRANDKWGWMLVEGILGIVAGIIVFRTPSTGAIVLLWLVAFWAITHGIAEIAAGIKLRKIIEGEWLLSPIGENGCRAELHMRFAFKNALSALLFEQKFGETMASLVDAFVTRARI